MASESFVQAAIPRFDGHYDHWSMLMENFLRSKEYWQVIEGGVVEPAGEAVLTDAQKRTLEELKLKDLKAKNYLFQAIDRTILETILNKDTSKHIWNSMKKKFQGSAKAKRQQLQALRTEFENLRMKNTESVSDYFSRTLTIVNRMRIHGEKIEDTFVVEKILRSMAEKFNYVVCSIEEAHDLDTLSLDELQGSLMVHEQKMIREEDKQEKALQATTNNPNSTSNADRENRKSPHKKPEEQKNETSQGRWRGRDNGYRPKNVDKSNIECYRCHRYGHYQYECRTNMNKKHSQQSNFAETEEVVSLLMACHGTEETHKNMWYLDTGCSNHMCGNKSAFSELDESFRNIVKFGDNSTVSVMGKGKVTIQAKEDFVHTLSNVFFVPDLRANLLSIGQLQEDGYEFVIKDGVCRIQDSNKGLIAQASMTTNRMFPLHLHNPTHLCFSAKVKDTAWLWHFRYGHLNFGGLKTLQQKNMVAGLPQIDVPTQVCEECIVSKQHRNYFPQRKSWRAKAVLELVHSDICGPINPTSNGGKHYFITFIDDYSRKTWTYFLQEKSEAFSVFKSFKSFVEKQAGYPIKVFRTDRGGEFNSHEFANFCETQGIQRQLTAAYTPQQNGVSERKNRTILNMVRSILTMSGVPKSFWPEAVNWSVHILNRSPTFSVQNMTPQEAWNGRKPSVDYFRIFGCVAYARIPEEKRRKLDDKGEKCIFLGVSEQSKAYKLYNPITKKIIISRDVIFDEDRFWSWEENAITQQIPTSYDNDDDNAKNNNQLVHIEQQSMTPHDATTISLSREPPADLASSSHSQRRRRRPAWMEDYEVSEIEDPITHFALFSDCDPIDFEVAVKETKWKKAMDDEIAAIERNHTWELTVFPKDKRRLESSGFTKQS